MFGLFKNKRRKNIKAQAFPVEWRKILEAEMPLYKYLSSEDQLELENHTKVLLSEKEFVGANGLSVTDEMRVLISAQAAILLLHREPHYFPNVDTIIIYEGAFVSEMREQIIGGVYVKKPEARIGESNANTGVVVLAWNCVKSGAANPQDGRNVVLHEFAHQLDSENGYVDGAPKLASISAYRAWSSVMSYEFEHLKAEIAHHHKTFIDQYGATSPAEFFAVITEAFFEKPLDMKKHHQQMYDLLVAFYQQNPVETLERARSCSSPALTPELELTSTC